MGGQSLADGRSKSCQCRGASGSEGQEGPGGETTQAGGERLFRIQGLTPSPSIQFNAFNIAGGAAIPIPLG
jgi:hypothetical protein